MPQVCSFLPPQAEGELVQLILFASCPILVRCPLTPLITPGNLRKTKGQESACKTHVCWSLDFIVGLLILHNISACNGSCFCNQHQVVLHVCSNPFYWQIYCHISQSVWSCSSACVLCSSYFLFPLYSTVTSQVVSHGLLTQSPTFSDIKLHFHYACPEKLLIIFVKLQRKPLDYEFSEIHSFTSQLERNVCKIRTDEFAQGTTVSVNKCHNPKIHSRLIVCACKLLF